MLERITLEGANVSAEIDAFIHHFMFGYDGVFKYGNKLNYEVVTNNLIKIKDGLIINQGRFIRIVPGSYEEIMIENGVTGTTRKDLIVVHFETDGINEIHDIRVIRGEDDGSVPSFVTGDTFNGSTVNELPLYLVTLNGINIETIEKQFDYIQSMKDTHDALISLNNAMPFYLTNNAQQIRKDLDPNKED